MSEFVGFGLSLALLLGEEGVFIKDWKADAILWLAVARLPPTISLIPLDVAFPWLLFLDSIFLSSWFVEGVETGGKARVPFLNKSAA